jgi:hypothetical protein
MNHNCESLSGGTETNYSVCGCRQWVFYLLYTSSYAISIRCVPPMPENSKWLFAFKREMIFQIVKESDMSL